MGVLKCWLFMIRCGILYDEFRLFVKHLIRDQILDKGVNLLKVLEIFSQLSFLAFKMIRCAS